MSSCIHFYKFLWVWLEREPGCIVVSSPDPPLPRRGVRVGSGDKCCCVIHFLWVWLGREPGCIVMLYISYMCGCGLEERALCIIYHHLLYVIFRKKPNLIVHLDVSPEESKRRIEMRQRECESTISIEYLRSLHAAYEEFIKDIARIIPVIRVNYEKFRTADEMADMIVR